VREIRMLRAMWRELEPWPWWNCEPNGSSKEPAWKPFTYRARASSRPYKKIFIDSGVESALFNHMEMV
jgi:hypothetical protein